jgi:hypothetical protein
MRVSLTLQRWLGALAAEQAWALAFEWARLLEPAFDARPTTSIEWAEVSRGAYGAGQAAEVRAGAFGWALRHDAWASGPAETHEEEEWAFTPLGLPPDRSLHVLLHREGHAAKAERAAELRLTASAPEERLQALQRDFVQRLDELERR